MNRKRIAVLSLVAIGLVVLYYFYGGSAVPSGQQPLVRLDNSNLASLQEGFNGSANSVRLLVLLSPT
jgi:hypothetical protein